MKRSIAGVARPKTTSNPSRRIWRRIAPHARRPRPISFGCSYTPAPTADVGPARGDAETFDVARRPVRYAAPAPHQDRRPRRRDEDDDPSALADLLPRAGYPALRSRTHTAPRHLTGGA